MNGGDGVFQKLLRVVGHLAEPGGFMQDFRQCRARQFRLALQMVKQIRYRVHQCGAFFVTRAKQNFRRARRYSRPVDKTTGLRFDQTVMLTGFDAQHDYPVPMCRTAIAIQKRARRWSF